MRARCRSACGTSRFDRRARTLTRSAVRGSARRSDASARRGERGPRARGRHFRPRRGERVRRAGPRRRPLQPDHRTAGFEADLRREDGGAGNRRRIHRFDDAVPPAAERLLHGLRDLLRGHSHREPAPDRDDRPRANGPSRRGRQTHGREARRQGRNRHAHRAPPVHRDFGAALEGLSAAILDRRAFIRDNTRLLRPPLAPRLRLYLADEAVALWQKTEEELGRIGLPPPFWAFAWAGGQALAGFLAERPETVAGKFVLDFASGSGLVAIAAAKAGAARVEASEVDDFALAAIEMNARENGVTIAVRSEDLVGRDDGWEVVLAGDISYQRDMAEPATDWLQRLAARGAYVWIGDPGRAYLARDRLECVAEYSVPVTRALEDADIKRSGVYRFREIGRAHV